MKLEAVLKQLDNCGFIAEDVLKILNSPDKLLDMIVLNPSGG